jgi:hypothetical protein
MAFKPLFKLAEIHEYPGSSLMPDYIIPLQTHQGFSFAVISEDISAFVLFENHNLGGSPKDVRMHCSGEQSTKLRQCDSPAFWRTITFS